MTPLSQLQEPQYKLTDNTFKAENAHFYWLFIQLGFHEITFAVYDTRQERYIALHSAFTHSNHTDAVKGFDEYVADHGSLLKANYARITVLTSPLQATLVPAPFYSKEQERTYLEFNFSKQLAESVLYSDYVKCTDAYCLFALSAHLDTAIKEYFPNAHIVHQSTSLINAAFTVHKQVLADMVFLQFRGNAFDIVVLKNEKLALYNAYQYSTVEDVLYYTLYTLQQVKLNADEVPVNVCGNFHPSGALYGALQTHLRNINFAQREKPQQYSYVMADVPAHEHFSILNRHLCEL